MYVFDLFQQGYKDMHMYARYLAHREFLHIAMIMIVTHAFKADKINEALPLCQMIQPTAVGICKHTFLCRAGFRVFIGFWLHSLFHPCLQWMQRYQLQLELVQYLSTLSLCVHFLGYKITWMVHCIHLCNVSADYIDADDTSIVQPLGSSGGK